MWAIAARLLCATLPLACTACLSFRGGELGETPAFEPRPEGPSVALVVTAYDLASNERRDAPALATWTEWVEDAYSDSLLFASVRSGFRDADLQVDVTIERREEGSLALASLSGLTLTLIPAWGRSELTMTSRFRDAIGNELVTTRKTESVHLWIQLLLLVAMPFGFPTVVAEDAMHDLALHSLAEAAPYLDRAIGAASASASASR